jgi:hypothetical protein
MRTSENIRVSGETIQTECCCGHENGLEDSPLDFSAGDSVSSNWLIACKWLQAFFALNLSEGTHLARLSETSRDGQLAFDREVVIFR